MERFFKVFNLIFILGILWSFGCEGTSSSNSKTKSSDTDESSSAASQTESLKTPDSSAASINFTDNDPDKGQVSGDILIEKANDESPLTFYVIYWGSSLTSKLTEGLAIAALQKTGSDLTYPLENNTFLPKEATHLLVFTKNDAGEMPSGVGVLINDLSSPVTENPTSPALTEVPLPAHANCRIPEKLRWESPTETSPIFELSPYPVFPPVPGSALPESPAALQVKGQQLTWNVSKTAEGYMVFACHDSILNLWEVWVSETATTSVTIQRSEASFLVLPYRQLTKNSFSNAQPGSSRCVQSGENWRCFGYPQFYGIAN
ncbi:hypothetical protein WDW89_07970 [Deltaproteobacteria bacterium TL4]